MEYKISKELLNATVQYLGTRPYAEVYQLIAALQKVAAPEEPSLDKPKKT